MKDLMKHGNVKDITGQRYGRWIALKRVEYKHKQSLWLCQCDCGKRKKVNMDSLIRGHSKSCGCLQREAVTKDITGQKFNRLTALRPTKKRVHTRVIWKWKCDCGTILEADNFKVRRGQKKSCGCLYAEIRQRAAEKRLAKRAGISKMNAREVVDVVKMNFGLICYSAEQVGVTYRTFLKALDILNIDPDIFRDENHNRVKKVLNA